MINKLQNSKDKDVCSVLIYCTATDFISIRKLVQKNEAKQSFSVNLRIRWCIDAFTDFVSYANT